MTFDDLLAEREIYRQLVKFSRAMDERDWLGLENIATEGITADLGTGQLQGRTALVECMRRFLDDCGPTQHMLGNVLIEVAGDSANSRAYINDLHLGARPKQHLFFRTLSDYRDEWQKVDGTWRMSHRTKINHAHIGSLEIFDR
jgi:hypothetical protein